jgi:hypothetical protein
METLPALARPFVMQTEVVEGEHFVLPAGPVTFLLTDVEGSSRLWKERPTEMGPAIAQFTRCGTRPWPRTTACARWSRARATASWPPSLVPATRFGRPSPLSAG